MEGAPEDCVWRKPSVNDRGYRNGQPCSTRLTRKTSLEQPISEPSNPKPATHNRMRSPRQPKRSQDNRNRRQRVLLRVLLNLAGAPRDRHREIRSGARPVLLVEYRETGYTDKAGLLRRRPLLKLLLVCELLLVMGRGLLGLICLLLLSLLLLISVRCLLLLGVLSLLLHLLLLLLSGVALILRLLNLVSALPLILHIPRMRGPMIRPASLASHILVLVFRSGSVFGRVLALLDFDRLHLPPSHLGRRRNNGMLCPRNDRFGDELCRYIFARRGAECGG